MFKPTFYATTALIIYYADDFKSKVHKAVADKMNDDFVGKVIKRNEK